MRKIGLLAAVLLLCGVPAFATGAPPLVNSDSGGVAGGTSFTVGSFTASTSGSLQVIAAFIQDTTTTISSLTWTGCTGNSFTTITQKGTGNQEILLYSPNGPASCTKVMVNLSASTSGDAHYAEYGGMATSSPLDNSVGGSGSSTTLSSGSFTSSCTNDTIVVEGGILQGGETFTVDDSYTIVIQRGGGSESEILEDTNVSAAGSQSAAPTVGTSGQYSIIAAAFKQSGSSCGSAVVNPPHASVM